MQPNPLALPLAAPEHWVTGFALANMLALALCIGIALWLIVRQPNTALRPGMILAGLMMLFFQIPLTLYAPLLEDSLPTHWWYAMVVYSSVSTLLLWLMVTPRLTLPSLYAAVPKQGARFPLLVTLGLLVMLVGIYLAAVPLRCTGLAALMHDPSLNLLVRELTVKLVGTNAATYAYGFVINTIAPMVMFFAMWQCYDAWRVGKPARILLLAPLVALALVATVLTATKGNLIPTFLILLIAGLLLARSWRGRLLNGIGALALLFVSFIVFQMVGERNAGNGTYPFGYCVTKLNACEDTQTLIASLRLREGSLGLAPRRINELAAETKLACAAHVASVARKERPSVAAVAPPRIVVLNPSRGEVSLNRFHQLAHGVLYRAFVTPFQVSVWYHLYVADHGRPGKLAYPLAKRIYGRSINMAEKVYQDYGVIYSEGDRTSTSTSPTSYLWAYPAYWGPFGLVLTIALTLLFECSATLVIRLSPPPLHVLAIGLMAVACFNFILSDYLTVWLTHGLFVACALLSFFILVERGPGWLTSWRAGRARRAR